MHLDLEIQRLAFSHFLLRRLRFSSLLFRVELPWQPFFITVVFPFSVVLSMPFRIGITSAFGSSIVGFRAGI